MPGPPASAGSLIGKQLGKYEILALLALGGTAEIYLARIGGALGFEKYVVVKCLHDHLADDSEFVKMFLDEARLVAALDHSNIVQTFELGEHQGRYYMVMEFLAGLSLAMVMRRSAERIPGGQIPVNIILNVASQAAAGLHYAHERTSGGKLLNIVHRDISPQNLVISFEGVVKIVDFGIARAELRETKTKVGTIKGKFAYMSPEQCVAKNIDRRTDVFALGVVVHELLTGRRLFKRESPYDTYQAVLECSVPRPSSVNRSLDPALDDIILKALAKDKEQRFATTEAFGDAIQQYLHRHAQSSGPSEIAKFFEAYFDREIAEHRARMSELMSGHFDSIDTGVGWNGVAPPVDPNTQEAIDLSSHDISVVGFDRPGTAGLHNSGTSGVHAGGGNGVIRDEETIADDGPLPEKTRIEVNPLHANDFPAPDSGAAPTQSLRSVGPSNAAASPESVTGLLPATLAPAGASHAPTVLMQEVRPANATLPGLMPVTAYTNQLGRSVPQIGADSATMGTVIPEPPVLPNASVPNPAPGNPPPDAAWPVALPPRAVAGLAQWQLALMFIAAVSAALLVTVLIAKLLR